LAASRLTAFLAEDFLAGFFFVALAFTEALLVAFFTPVFFVFLVLPLGVLLAAFLAGAFFDFLAMAGSLQTYGILAQTPQEWNRPNT
jgi:hypothetical protein